MRIVCPSCATSYTIPDGKIGPLGRTVRCARCQAKWHVNMEGDDDEDEDNVGFFADEAVPPAEASAIVGDPWDSVGAEAEADPAPSDEEEADAHGVIAFDEDDTPEEDAAQETTFDFEAPEADVPSPAARAAALIEPPEKPEAAPHRDIESLAKPKVVVKPRTTPSYWMLLKKHLWRMRSVLFRWRLSVGVAIFIVAVLFPLGAIVFRAQIVRSLPQIAGLYAEIGMPVNLTGLEFRNLNTLRELENGQPVLVVEGSVANVTLQALYVPSVRMSLRGADGQEIYAWSVDPKAATVPAGDEVRFRSRLAAPPEEAVDVQLRFIERKTRQAVLP
jgi:predicted Zn finger-like uncharacterized protein